MSWFGMSGGKASKKKNSEEVEATNDLLIGNNVAPENIVANDSQTLEERHFLLTSHMDKELSETRKIMQKMSKRLKMLEEQNEIIFGRMNQILDLQEEQNCRQHNRLLRLGKPVPFRSSHTPSSFTKDGLDLSKQCKDDIDFGKRFVSKDDVVSNQEDLKKDFVHAMKTNRNVKLSLYPSLLGGGYMNSFCQRQNGAPKNIENDPKCDKLQ